VDLQENVMLAPFTTLRIGGPARFFCAAADETDVGEAQHFASGRGLPLFVLGGGSNLLVADEGFPGIVVHMALQGAMARADDGDCVVLDVSAGTDWDALVRYTCEQGLCGMECLAGIPGLVGGSPVQNIGAYGQEVSTSIESVRALDRRTGFFTELTAEACEFSYRRSIFNSTRQNRYVVTSVRFRLERQGTPNLSYADLAPLRGTHATPLDVYHFVRQVRERKGMLIDPVQPHADSRSAGSFFKNPVVRGTALERIAKSLGVAVESVPNYPVASSRPEASDPAGTVAGDDPSQAEDEKRVKLPAAWLIECAGFPKGFALGPVGISTRHTLALVNRSGQATCAELLALRDLIVNTVVDRFGVRLEQEPVLLR
jgi:UDP-N-acetylmuramate dehydrogenase